MALAAIHDVPACVMRESESVYHDSVITVDDSGHEKNKKSRDAIGTTIRTIKIGHITYPLRHSLRATYVPGKGDFLVEGFSPLFVGNGTNQEAARADWNNTVHSAFQELQPKRPFEMSDDERLKWQVLSDHIDVTVFRNNTPQSIRAFGRILKAGPYPQLIEWDNGLKEPISLEIVDTPDFVRFKPGQPFEAVVHRDPLTFNLIRIIHIERTQSPHRFEKSIEREIIDRIGSSKVLRDANW